MIAQAEKLNKLATEQWTSEVKIDAKRGRILDRNGSELAVSANVFRIDLDLNTIRSHDEKNMSKAEIANKLASSLNMDPLEVLKKLDTKLTSGLPAGASNLARRIEKEQADKVRDLGLRGVLISSDTKRYYKNDNFLAQVLGHTTSDGIGLTGVEKVYNSVLAGVPGVRIAETDNKSKVQDYTISDYTKPIDGKDLVLTIDETIQQFCEKAAVQALNDTKAKAVTIIAMNPNNGEILAMANKPDYNPNDPWMKGQNVSSDELQKMWRNRAVNDTFEPGSIFKVVTATAAMSESVISDNDHWVCSGSSKVANRVIHCWKRTGHGSESFVDILKNSCNVGFMDLGKRLGKDKLYKYIGKFGFGEKTGIDLPGEAKGIIKKPDKMNDVDVATISFGQSNTVSAIQYITGLNAIANGGKLIEPHVMKQITHSENNKTIVDKEFSDYNTRTVLDENVVKSLRGYLEKVVSEGGGKNAYIPGYHIAGKTGTAQKVNSATGSYEAGKYISSFGGMAPAENPKITLFVSIDEPDPSNYYAGQITAPVAKQVFNDIFNYLSIDVDASSEDIAKSMLKEVIIPEVRGLKKDQAAKILKGQQLDYQFDGSGEFVTDINPKPGYSVKEGSKLVLYTGTTSNYNKVVVVPDLKGFNKENAQNILNTLGLKTEFDGEGLVSEQSISPLEQVSKGTTITLKLDEIGD
jgi:stage V sporulation protein D (sporulation-specific penicillin-binding protein)